MADISNLQSILSRLTFVFGCVLDFQISLHGQGGRKMRDPWDLVFDKSLESLFFDIVLEYSEKLHHKILFLDTKFAFLTVIPKAIPSC